MNELPAQDIRREPIAILGSGAWGTAVALHFARHQHPVRLWTRSAEHAETMQKERCNNRHLPGFTFPENLHIFSDLTRCIGGVEYILIMVPSCAFRPLLMKMAPLWGPKKCLLWGTKGRDNQAEPAKFLHESVLEILNQPLSKLGVISGPTFAEEVAQEQPTALTIASPSRTFRETFIQHFHTPTLRFYPTADLVGVEVAGLIKNILAVACGVADGLSLGNNARSTLITRGIEEAKRLGKLYGAEPATLTSLAGIGDIVLTCTSNQSRNYRLGFAIGQGKNVTEARKNLPCTESLNNIQDLYQQISSNELDMPIATQVYRLLIEEISAKEALNALLERAPIV